MAFQSGYTIKETLDDILKHNLVLPAIQREFVWQPEQICRLFDSLMQGYPFGTFLYWRVNRESSDTFKFYDFILNYHQRDNPHCPLLPPLPNQQLTGVLDGQQRLTALNIGLRGSMALRRRYGRQNSPNAFPKRQLYLDILWRPDDDNDDGTKYLFNFLTDEQIAQADNTVCWFPVATILQMENAGPALTRWLNKRLQQEEVDEAHDILFQLYQVVHTKPLVAFYEENSQELDKVLQIFIRTNSGGTFLSYSDMLLSVAVAQWADRDAREEIHTLVDELNRIGAGFSFSKDFVLKAGLMLSDIGSVGFRVDNFNRENMAILENKWDEIKLALKLTAQLVSDFGFNEKNLRADNAILPIAYYLYKKNPKETYLTHNMYSHDRHQIRDWLVRSLLKSGVWGSGLDVLLTALRQVIRERGTNKFPVTEIREEMARRGRSLVFEEEEIEDLVDMEYNNRLTFALLSLLFPFIDLRNQFHVDHVFPSTRFTQRRLSAASVPKEKIVDFIQFRNRLGNFQLLHGAQNLEKSSKMPSKWLRETYPDPKARKEYRRLHKLGKVPEKMADFETFYIARRRRLKRRIGKLLGR